MAQSEASTPRRTRERSCAACRTVEPSTKLVRVVRADDGQVFPDLAASAFGRGAWLHPTPACLKRAASGLSRTFRAQVTTSPAELTDRLAEAGQARAWQLLGTAKRRKRAVFGGTEAEQALAQGRARLLIVARDARAVADSRFVQEAVTRGIARPWGDKAQLGALFCRAEVGVVAIVDERLADGIFDAIAMALLASESAQADVHRADGSAAQSGEGAVQDASKHRKSDFLTEVE